MRARRIFSLWLVLFFAVSVNAQLLSPKETFTKADTLRGSDNENRDWWDVMKYDITIKPNYTSKTIEGTCEITLNVIKEGKLLQIDLQDSLLIDSVAMLVPTYPKDKGRIFLPFVKKDGVYLITSPSTYIGKKEIIKIYYHGKPREAVKPPWDGGFIWTKDKQGNPWISVACQGLGASSWFPCKDVQGDEPDNGATLTIIAPDSLNAIGNGRLNKTGIKYSTRGITWQVKNPINNYNIIPYIGKYKNFTDTLMGEGGKLDLSYWVLEYNLEKAKNQFKQVKPMLHCFEHWFGKYPFYEDSYKLVESPYIGMEHQSAVAYGNDYKNGYHGIDLSATGWGMKWDFIIVHESGHEWFGNNITSKDLADQWIHESFTMYSEVLYTQWMFGNVAGDEYCVGLRHNILNDKPIIGPCGVNKEGSGDMYYKGANMIHSIRHIINNDSLFRQILRGLNTAFYHQTVTTKQIEDYIIKKCGINLQPVFNQYLRTTQIPKLLFTINEDASTVTLNWSNCIDSFNMPLTIPLTSKRLLINTEKKTLHLSKEEMNWFTKENLERYYFIEVN